MDWACGPEAAKKGRRLSSRCLIELAFLSSRPPVPFCDSGDWLGPMRTLSCLHSLFHPKCGSQSISQIWRGLISPFSEQTDWLSHYHSLVSLSRGPALELAGTHPQSTVSLRGSRLSLWVWEMLWKHLEFDPSCKVETYFYASFPFGLEWMAKYVDFVFQRSQGEASRQF